VAPVRERSSDIIKQGKSENDVLAAQATLDYDMGYSQRASLRIRLRCRNFYRARV
jgi:hypothetical protein